MRRLWQFTQVVAVLVTVFAGTGSAKTFYVSRAGDDTHSGQSPEDAWQTLERTRIALVHGEFAAGDTILLRRGDVFRGQWGVSGIPIRGSAEATVRLGAYGNGTPPVIDGDESARAWSLVPGYTDIYEMVLDQVQRGAGLCGWSASSGRSGWLAATWVQ